ncbi:MAG: FAD binding domain-containing protein [Pseudomonadota bacterium]|nr:FAD binding domain-containing protein [Pseudomonadota bacterium]
MRGVEILRPGSFAEALDLLAGGDPETRPMSGGTALILMMKTGVFQPERLVSLDGVEPDYGAITVTQDGGLHIGALATLSALGRHPEVARLTPIIHRAMPHLSNVRVRNVACVGGALAHGDPHMDLPPILAALGADVEIASAKGARSVPVEQFIRGYYETVLEPGELISGVSIPPQTGWVSGYRKCTTRAVDDWPALGIAVALSMRAGAVARARVVVSAATEKLTRVGEAEAVLLDGPLRPERIAEAAEAAAGAVETMDDALGSAGYKTQLLRVHLRRLLTDIAGGESAT